MLNYIQRWHRNTVNKIAATLGLPEDLSHHQRARVTHRHVHTVHQRHNRHITDWHHRHNQRIADWHARHLAEVLAGTNGLHRWERFVYRQVSRFAK
ncbi:hypothetical protein N007_18850 [Alicyclobacillus acidoterrestris ATCC 49025]|nr:hypothetical protein N007_18850 [Alicyclobacillus acidoterrestris ATCC 49025]